MSNDVSFEINDDGKLTVRIDTERLVLDSVVQKDAKIYYDNLWSQADVMNKFATGNTTDLESVTKRVENWIKRYSQNNPFSSLKVQKNDDDSFVGTVVAGYGDDKGESELSYLFAKKTWGQGYGKEAVGSVVNDWTQEVVRRGYRVNKSEANPEGDKFTTIVATSRQDNPGSIKILEDTCKMTKYKEEEKFGHLRNHYRKDIAR